MFYKMECHLQEINNKMQTLAATNVAKQLAAFVSSTSHPVTQSANVATH